MKIQNVLDAVSEVTGVPKNDIIGTDRFKQKVFARHLFCYFARTKTNATLLQIGNALNRHHSTVINSLRLIDDMISIDDELTKDYVQKIDSYILNKYQQDKVLKIFLPYDTDIKKVVLFLQNEYKAECVKIS